MSSKAANKKILVADDEPDVLQLVSMNLKNAGFNVLKAEDGMSALTQARELTDRMGAVVTTARARVDETKQTVVLWVLRITIAVTALAGLATAGQLFMARYCWRVLRRKPA